jgi:hypothetical protein
MHLDCRSKRRRQDDLCTPLSARKRTGGPLHKCRSYSERLVALETGSRGHCGGPNGIGGNRSPRAERADFAFETTLSGLTYEHRLKSWKLAGYRIDVVYLKLSSSRLALRRVAARVRQGGHNVPQADVLRRFVRGWDKFQRIYRPLADSWAVYDNSGRAPRLLEKGR